MFYDSHRSDGGKKMGKNFNKDMLVYRGGRDGIFPVGLGETVCEEDGPIEFSQNFVQLRALDINIVPPLPVYRRFHKIAKNDF
jgi:hypothetical protein